SKVKISEQINLFEIESKKLASDAELTIKDEERQKLTGLEEKLSRKNTENLRNINEANQKVIDEKTGVRADYSTGKVGDGPRAKELQAEVRRLQSQAELDAKVAMEQIERESSLIKEQAKDELKKLQVANKMVDERFIIIKKTVNSAKNFKELENALIEVNGTLSTIAAKLKVEYKPVEIVGSDNIIKLSFSALTNFEITAWVCLLLAILMEIGDIVIVYVIRYQKEEHEKPLLKLAKSENDVQKYIYKKTYSGY
ncbi:hypothetical protein EBU95_18060, partial [bacterium]|nr:hypothetical protein [bacterium]